jgi:hypothetical protein
MSQICNINVNFGDKGVRVSYTEKEKQSGSGMYGEVCHSYKEEFFSEKDTQKAMARALELRAIEVKGMEDED